MSARPIFRSKSITGFLLLSCLTGCATSRFGGNSECARIEISDVQCNQCESNPDAKCGCANTIVIPAEEPELKVSPEIAPPSPIPAENKSAYNPFDPVGESIASPSKGNVFSRMGQSWNNLINKNRPVPQEIYKEASQVPKFPTQIDMNELEFDQEQIEEFPIANPETALPPVPENEINNKIARKDVSEELWNPLGGFSTETDMNYRDSESVMKEKDIEEWPYQVIAQPVLHSQKTVLGIRKISQEVHANKAIMIVPETVK